MLLIQPLPLWAAIIALAVFPLSVALTELPLYFGYVQPRLHTRSGSSAAAVLIPAAQRPRLLPYLIVVHFVLDLQAAISILLISG